MDPPILLCSLYLPPRVHGFDSFDQVITSFQQDIEAFRNDSPGLFVLGGGDLNTQLAPSAGPTGRFVGSGERPGEQDRSEAILAMLGSLSLKLPNTFSTYGPTRTPWTGKEGRDSPSTIDFLFCSEKTVSLLWPDRKPATGISSDHRPIGAGYLAPRPRRRRERANLSEHCFTGTYKKGRRLPAQWSPANEVKFRNALRQVPLNHLDDLPEKILDAAQASKAQDMRHKPTPGSCRPKRGRPLTLTLELPTTTSFATSNNSSGKAKSKGAF